MITAASLKSQTVKDLAQMARQLGVSGWHAMRKDQLVSAVMRAAKSQKASRRKAVSNGQASTGSARKAKPSRRGAQAGGKKRVNSGRRASSKATARGKAQARSQAKRKSPRVLRRIQEVNEQRQRQKDLAAPFATQNGSRHGNGQRSAERDRVVLLVRDPYWLQACWELTRNSIERAQAAMAEQWHMSRPVLRVLEVDSGTTTSTAERVSRDIDIHGGVTNWYIDVQDPPKSFRVEIGYLSAQGRFYSLARSNTVTTPSPGSSDAIDEHWTEIAENYEKIFALSGGYDEESADGELRDLFEERLRRPMGSPVVTRYGAGAERALNRHRDFGFEVDAEVIIYGTTKPDAHVTLAGEPLKLRPDGTFTVRLSMPDRRQVLPVVASSADGVEQRTIVLAIERNTKVMEPVVRESNE